MTSIFPSSASIRKGFPSDLSPLFESVNRCVEWMQRQQLDQWDETYPTSENFKLDLEAGHLYLIEINGVIAASVTMDLNSAPEYSGVTWATQAPSGIVHRLMVHPAFQGQGLAKRLMHYLEKECVQKKYSSLRLDAFTKNAPALKLYTSLGYTETGLIQLSKGIFQCFEKEI